MKIVIVGAGLAGTSAAYALARRAKTDCSITVVDAGSDVATVTSFANAGRFCPTSLSFGSPASKTGIQRTLLPDCVKTHLLPLPTYDTRAPQQHHMTVNFLRPTLLYWGICNVFFQNKERAQRGHRLLADRAVKTMQETLRSFSASALSQMAIRPGTLYMFLDDHALEVAKQKVEMINHTSSASSSTYAMTVLGTEASVTRFPFLREWKSNTANALPLASRVPGCVHVDSDWTADARAFVKGLVETIASTRVPVVFKLNTHARLIDGNTVHMKHSNGSEEVVKADVVVLACGVQTNKLLPRGRRRLPLEGMRGFSVDLSGCQNGGREGHNLPEVGVVDFSSGDLNFQLTPFERDRLRIVGFADFVGEDGKDEPQLNKVSAAVLVDHLRFLLPSLTWTSQRGTWSGLRPMTPDNLPYVGHMAWGPGRTKVWVCCGHGSTGWTSATATADVLAHHIFPSEEGESKEMTELMDTLRPDRFESALGTIGSFLADTLFRVV